jgi:exonuclease VII large subunit
MNTAETIQIDTSRVDEKESEVLALVTSAGGVAITTPEQLEDANGCLIKIKEKIKELDEDRKDLTRPIDGLKKKIMDKYKPWLDKLDQAKGVLTKAIMAYTDEQEKKRRELQDKLQREADEKARKEQERLQARADKWEEKGNTDKAEALREKADEVVPDAVPVVLTMPTPKGLSYRDNWKAVVVDINMVPREYMIPDQKALDKIMQATKGTVKIPGIKAVNEKVLMSRSA